MSVEYIDSFEQQSGSSGRYTRGGGSRSNGRGTGHVGSFSINSSGYAGRAVSANATKAQGIAIKLQAAAKTGIMAFVEAGGTTRHVYIGWTSAGKIEVRRGDNAGTVLATSTTALWTVGAYVHVEAKVTVNDTTGSVAVRVDEIPVTFDNSLTNVDTKNGGTSGLIEECWVGSDDGNNDTNYDDWYIHDGSTWIGDKRVGVSSANVAGTYSSGTASSGTLLSCVDENSANLDTDYVAMDSTGLPKAISFGLEDAPSNTLAILAVQPWITVRKDDAGSNTGRLLLISGATEDDGGADIAAASTYADKLRLHETDPNTGVAWTTSGFNAIEVGWRRTA